MSMLEGRKKRHGGSEMPDTPDPTAIRKKLPVLEAELEADARLAQLRERFGIEQGEPRTFPLFSPVLDRSDGLAVRRVWCWEDDEAGYLIERED